MAVKLGSIVRQKVFVIEGAVDDYGQDKSDGTTLLHVQYLDANGEPAAKYFREDEVDVIAGPGEPDPALTNAKTPVKTTARK